jgi:hypothetical protein
MEAALSGISVFKFLKTLRKTTSRNNWRSYCIKEEMKGN